jgi:hypothetical protein
MAKASQIAKVTVLSPTNVWAVGQKPRAKFSQIQHFNGTNWTVVSSPHFRAGETLHSLKAVSADNIFAVGETLDNLRKFRAFSQRWALAGLLLLQFTLAARAQGPLDESINAATAPVTFNFEATPDILVVGSLSADSENGSRMQRLWRH